MVVDVEKIKEERRHRDQEVRVDRRKGDDDLVEHVIGGVRRTYERGSGSDDRPIEPPPKR